MICSGKGSKSKNALQAMTSTSKLCQNGDGVSWACHMDMEVEWFFERPQPGAWYWARTEAENVALGGPFPTFMDCLMDAHSTGLVLARASQAKQASFSSLRIRTMAIRKCRVAFFLYCYHSLPHGA